MAVMHTLLERLVARGWQLTPQRQVVAQVLTGAHVHLTADEVVERARKRMPGLGRATVYKTLSELAAMGEVREVSLGARAKHYDPNPSRDHQHLVCDGCGLTCDVVPGDAGVPPLPPRMREGFAVTHVDVVYRGLCPACVAKG